MRCPRLVDLPAPEIEKSGWPWTTESQTASGSDNDRTSWPKISIVTVNFNYGQFIEETIRSVLLQGYPDLEYIIIDNGSTDNSVKIIKKYEKWLTFWAVDPNKGQPKAINTGMQKVTGDIFNWINSDDILTCDCLSKVAALWRYSPGSLICGRALLFDDNGSKKIIHNANISLENLIFHWTGRIHFAQPAIWIPAQAIERVGPLDESFYYFFDFDWVARLVQHYPVCYTDSVFSGYRLHPLSKTVSFNLKGRDKELKRIGLKHIKSESLRNKEKQFHDYYNIIDWYEELEKIREGSSGRLGRAARIFTRSICSSQRLFSRFTWGALRRILFS